MKTSLKQVNATLLLIGFLFTQNVFAIQQFVDAHKYADAYPEFLQQFSDFNSEFKKKFSEFELNDKDIRFLLDNLYSMSKIQVLIVDGRIQQGPFILGTFNGEWERLSIHRFALIVAKAMKNYGFPFSRAVKYVVKSDISYFDRDDFSDFYDYE